MPLLPGDPECTIGLSKRIRDSLLANPATGADDNAALRAFSFAIATAVVTEILTTAVVVGTAPPGGGPIAAVIT
jgi:hypothetical protein